MAKYANIYDTPQSYLRRIAGPMLCMLIMFYLGFHAVSGERGVFALFSQTRKLEALKTELAGLKAKHETLEHKVKLLSNNSLDLDLLDEQVRLVLGMAHKNEVVYFMDNNDKQ